VNILDELAEQGDRPTHEQRDRAVRRMKRDRNTINQLVRQRETLSRICSELQNELRAARNARQSSAEGGK